MNNEIYAALEITKQEIRFVVGKFRSHQPLKIIFKDRFKGEWLDDQDRVLDEKAVTYRVNKAINLYESNFKQKLTSISLVYPSKTIIPKDATPSINLSSGGSPRMITQADIKHLINESQSVSFENDRTVLNVRPIYFSCDSQKKKLEYPLGIIAHRLEMLSKVYTISKDVYQSHRGIIKACGREILNSSFQTYTLAKQIIEPKKFSLTSVMVNWDYDKIDIAFFAKETMVKHYSINSGVKTVIKNIANRLNSKNDVAEKYLFKIIDFTSSKTDKQIAYRKYDSKTNINQELKNADIKEIICEEIFAVIDKMDILVERELHALKSFPIYHAGKITEIAGFEKILHRSQYKQNAVIYFSTVTGASEIWTTSLCGSIELIKTLNKSLSTMKTSIGQFDKEVQRINQNVRPENISVGRPMINNMGLPRGVQLNRQMMPMENNRMSQNYQNSNNFAIQNGIIKTRNDR